MAYSKIACKISPLNYNFFLVNLDTIKLLCYIQCKISPLKWLAYLKLACRVIFFFVNPCSVGGPNRVRETPESNRSASYITLYIYTHERERRGGNGVSLAAVGNARGSMGESSGSVSVDVDAFSFAGKVSVLRCAYFFSHLFSLFFLNNNNNLFVV